MNKKQKAYQVLAITLAVAFGALVAPAVASAEEAEVSLNTEVSEETFAERPKTPGFRTDLGVQFSFGGHSCIGGGSDYATCGGTNVRWDTSWGLGGGFIARPFKLFSLGVNVSYYNMKFRRITENKWSDLLLGPVGKFHFPFRLGTKDLLFEPNIGLQVGFAKGTFKERMRETGQSVDWNHEHLGAFLGLPFGVDFFPIPKLGVGLEFKVVRTFYTEVCFEHDQVACRGVNDKALTKRYDLPDGGVPNDKGVASYPWKLFWGLHVLYYL